MMLIVALGLLLGLLALAIPVAATLAIIALVMENGFSMMPLSRAMGEIAWSSNAHVLLLSIPLFILLGEVLLRAGIADRMYQAMAQWLSWMPGGLMHSNIGASMMFAATAGSSVATAATVSTVAVPLIDRYKYNERLFLGSLASGGTLGILIPPSINLIIFGWLTETSVPALYLAGIIPGVILGLLFMATVAIACIIKPSLDGQRIETSWSQRIATLPALLPPLAIFALIIGSIYAGIATPTESASLGLLGGLALAAMNRTLSLDMLRQAIEGTLRTTGMIMLIITAGFFLNFVFSAVGVTAQLNAFIVSQGFGPVGTLALVCLFYIVLGCFMEPLPLMIITVPIITPLLVSMGYDPVWFGIIVVLLIETALITPPVGINLFVVQGVRRRGSIDDLMVGALPFVGALFAMIILTILVPDLALWLPNLMK